MHRIGFWLGQANRLALLFATLSSGTFVSGWNPEWLGMSKLLQHAQ
jgi:hypothetical protein